MANKQSQNLMDLVPVRQLEAHEREPGLFTVTLPHRGLFNRIAQRFFHRPAASAIDLDRFGSFVWAQIDGERSVYEIGLLVRERFGDEAEPLFERLSVYFGILREHRFIDWKEDAPCNGSSLPD